MGEPTFHDVERVIAQAEMELNIDGDYLARNHPGLADMYRGLVARYGQGGNYDPARASCKRCQGCDPECPTCMV